MWKKVAESKIEIAEECEKKTKTKTYEVEMLLLERKNETMINDEGIVIMKMNEWKNDENITEDK